MPSSSLGFYRRGNPEPWFCPARNTWYVTINGRQHNLYTADKDDAYRRWHELMVQAQQAIRWFEV